ncbi:2972_t:CDS:2 [Cetraspora pellucida]|uniref:2972_t:CDS:1 n=1 Tax=Cetraspora pellucida TaxID=1433469 RepID=A0A9N9BMU4_9GLOM|nr:2972_t:CDS:2 [Cetraspora pellucida]
MLPIAVDSLSFLDTSKDNLNDDWELFVNNIRNATSEAIKVQYANLDYKNESDQDEQIDNRILEIQQGMNIVRDKIKGEYNDFDILHAKMRNEVTNLLEEINTENTKLNVRLWGTTAYEIGVKEVPYSWKNRIKFLG